MAFFIRCAQSTPVTKIARDPPIESVARLEACVVPLAEPVTGKEDTFKISSTAFFMHPKGLLFTAAHAMAANNLYVNALTKTD